MGVPANNSYHFVTRWRVEGTLEEVTQIIGDAEGLPRWWPSVYLEVEVLDPGDAQRGRVVRVFTKGWLPYTLRWTFRVVDRSPTSWTILASGDFEGRGTWKFVADGAFVDVTYDWNIVALKPLLRYLSPVLKPIFAMNHEWAMKQGEKSLLLELQRRRATTPGERALVPPPPPATPRSLLGLIWSGLSFRKPETRY